MSDIEGIELPENWQSKKWWIHFHNGDRRDKILVYGDTKTHARKIWEARLKGSADSFVKIKKA